MNVKFGEHAHRTSDLIDFMSHSLALEEDRIGSHTFKDVAGLGGDEFLMSQGGDSVAKIYA